MSPEKVHKFLMLYLYISFILQVSALIYDCVKSKTLQNSDPTKRQAFAICFNVQAYHI